MLLYPAIDVQGGGLARADRGGDPVALARSLADAGVAWAHVVDLDRVRAAGRRDDVIRAVIAALPGVRVQLGGGLRDPDDVRQALDWGVARVVLGTGTTGDLGTLVGRFGSAALAVTVGPHPLSPPPSGRGRTADPVPAPEELVDTAVRAGVSTVVYRDHARDGTLDGADVEGAARLLGRGADVILAGGIAGLDEIRRARDLGLVGVIVGRALLTGRFTLAEAIACCG
jgi:phosphoribosylformimino-5-aminoimidazole carboxamide ribonucleotide (ProFAR) isomerase